jgi:hypothetical protein
MAEVVVFGQLQCYDVVERPFCKSAIRDQLSVASQMCPLKAAHLRRIKHADLTTTPNNPEGLDSIIEALYLIVSDTANKCMSLKSLDASIRDVCVIRNSRTTS